MNPLLLLIAIFFILFPVNVYGGDTWQLLYQPRQRIVKTIGTFRELIFIGTGNGVFVSKDKGRNWQDFGSSQLLKDNSGNVLINWIYVSENEEKIYIATSFGAYYSSVYEPNWKILFKGVKTESAEINSLALDGENIYLATNDGFWKCRKSEDLCDRLNQGLEADNLSGNHEVFYNLKNNNNLLLGASSGIYLFDEKARLWYKVSNQIQELPNGKVNVRHLLIDEEKNLWAACGTGVYFSQDGGKSWERKADGIRESSDGFQEVFYLFESASRLYAACASGIYYLDSNDNVWKDFTGGIRTKEGSKNVYWLDEFQGDFYAATDEGLFISDNLALASDKKQTANSVVLVGKIETDFANLEEIEPSVIEVQKQALKFASLPNTKDYKRYRAQARLRNLIPSVAFDINTTGTSLDYSQFEKGILADTSLNNKFDAATTTRYQRDGRAFKQLSVLWRTNEFLYDDEIREILNQARLTANIKENLLDDVTRIYYKRRKLQLETILTPPKDVTDKLANQIAISELTGQLDSRTGGWFSKEVERRRK